MKAGKVGLAPAFILIMFGFGIGFLYCAANLGQKLKERNAQIDHLQHEASIADSKCLEKANDI
jgi:hypothetical protein